MNKLYVIQWKSKVNGRAGKGTKLFEYEEGQRLVDELNLEYPQIEHELIDHRPPPPETEQPQPPQSEIEVEETAETEQPTPAPVH